MQKTRGEGSLLAVFHTKNMMENDRGERVYFSIATCVLEEPTLIICGILPAVPVNPL
jgi:hypothetical protein